MSSEWWFHRICVHCEKNEIFRPADVRHYEIAKRGVNLCNECHFKRHKLHHLQNPRLYMDNLIRMRIEEMHYKPEGINENQERNESIEY